MSALRVAQIAAHVIAAALLAMMGNWWAVAWVAISAVSISEAICWHGAYRLRCER